jgi:hypothetical protein
MLPHRPLASMLRFQSQSMLNNMDTPPHKNHNSSRLCNMDTQHRQSRQRKSTLARTRDIMPHPTNTLPSHPLLLHQFPNAPASTTKLVMVLLRHHGRSRRTMLLAAWVSRKRRRDPPALFSLVPCNTCHHLCPIRIVLHCKRIIFLPLPSVLDTSVSKSTRSLIMCRGIWAGKSTIKRVMCSVST